MDFNPGNDLFEKREPRDYRSPTKAPWKDRGFLKKQMTSSIDQPHLLQRISDRLPDDGCPDNWNDMTSYSLNKKGRWNLIEDLRTNIDDWNDHMYDGPVSNNGSHHNRPAVSFLERHYSMGKQRAMGRAFHGMETDDYGYLTPVHRYAKHGFAYESTLTQKSNCSKPKKTSKPRRSHNDRRPVHRMQEEEPEVDEIKEVPRLQYEITTVQDPGRRKDDSLVGENGYKRRGKRCQKHVQSGKVLLNEWVQEDLMDLDEWDESVSETEPAVEEDLLDTLVEQNCNETGDQANDQEPEQSEDARFDDIDDSFDFVEDACQIPNF